MSYPYDIPSLSMSTIWNSGSYKPTDVVRSIRDNYTPVNKNSMVNSVGHEISMIQNYINSKYLGRADVPVQTGYVQELISNSGNIYVYNSGTYPADAETRILPNKIIFQSMIDSSPFDIPSSGYIASSGIYVSYNDPNLMNINNCSLNSSGVSIIYGILGLEYKNLITPTGISFLYGGANEIGLYSNLSGEAITLEQGRFVVNSGEPYGGPTSEYSLTVGKYSTGGGDAFIKTYGGAGIEIRGDNGNADRIKSIGDGTLHVQIGSTDFSLSATGVMGLPADATTAQTSYDLVNAIKALLIERGLAT